MPVYSPKPKGRLRWWAVLQRKDVLSGLLFMGVAVFGLWVSRGYPIGTASSMGTGYMPRLLLWVLLGLGGLILVSGLWTADRLPEADTSGAVGAPRQSAASSDRRKHAGRHGSQWGGCAAGAAG